MNVICFGDSNTWGYDPRSYFGERYDSPWPELLAEKTGWNICNWGENGREIPRTGMHIPETTDLLIIMLGTNDLLQLRSPEEACGKMERFLVSQHQPRQKILLIAPPPMKPGQWVQDQKRIAASLSLAKQYRTLAERLGVRFADAGQWNIPLAFDGVHLTEEGHRAFAEGLIKELNSA